MLWYFLALIVENIDLIVENIPSIVENFIHELNMFRLWPYHPEHAGSPLPVSLTQSPYKHYHSLVLLVAAGGISGF